MVSSNREVLLWTREGMKGFGHGQAQEGDLDTGQRKGSLWVRANTRDALGAYKLEGVFWIRAGEKGRFEHGQTLKEACEGGALEAENLKSTFAEQY